MAIIKSAGYSIHIGNGVFKSLSAFLNKARYSAYFILCDENTLQHCLPALITACPKLAEAHIIEIESGESSKSLEFCAHIWQTFLENTADKKTLLINLGGGVVTDLGGFTASVYKRGIDFIHLPTSLLAMADASVGGKTGIDFYGIKNVIGSFAMPKGVFIYPGFLSSLPLRQYQNGLAEVFKIALVSSNSFWEQLISGKPDSTQLITESVRLKNEIVMQDTFDKGRRNSLNFGHTVGHALEALCLDSGQDLLHGEAIVIGMLIESRLAFQKKLISKQTLQEITSALRHQFTRNALPPVDAQALLTLMHNDKKTRGAKLNFALVDGIGSCQYSVEITAAQLEKAMAAYAGTTL